MAVVQGYAVQRLKEIDLVGVERGQRDITGRLRQGKRAKGQGGAVRGWLLGGG